MASMYLILALIGAISGALIARKRKGKVTDILHYAFVYALAFGLLGLILTVIADRTII